MKVFLAKAREKEYNGKPFLEWFFLQISLKFPHKLAAQESSRGFTRLGSNIPDQGLHVYSKARRHDA